jgi:hypothetical protein
LSNKSGTFDFLLSFFLPQLKIVLQSATTPIRTIIGGIEVHVVLKTNYFAFKDSM